MFKKEALKKMGYYEKMPLGEILYDFFKKEKVLAEDIIPFTQKFCVFEIREAVYKYEYYNYAVFPIVFHNYNLEIVFQNQVLEVSRYFSIVEVEEILLLLNEKRKRLTSLLSNS